MVWRSKQAVTIVPGVLEHRVRHSTQRALRHRIRNIESWKTELILIYIVTKITTNSIQVFHAFYKRTWAVTTKREPLSFSLSLIITFHPLHLLLGPTRLFVTCPLFTLPHRFILGCLLRFGHLYLVVGGGQHLLFQSV